MSQVLDAVRCQHEVLLRTRLHTTLAPDALLLGVHLHRLVFKTFRIVTPHASKGTSLYENGRPDTGSVIDGKPLNVENQCQLVLLLAAKVRKSWELGVRSQVVGIASHTHEQVFVVIGLLLGIEQGLCINDVELDMVSTHAEIGADEGHEFHEIFIALQE